MSQRVTNAEIVDEVRAWMRRSGTPITSITGHDIAAAYYRLRDTKTPDWERWRADGTLANGLREERIDTVWELIEREGGES